MSDQSAETLNYDPSNVYLPAHGLNPSDLPELAPKLNQARDELFADLRLLRSADPIPEHKKPLDAGFIDLPDRLLADHRDNPATSELSKILRAAEDLRSSIDRLVVIGIGGSYMGTRSLFEACCHPHHNELNRVDRNDRPRLYFAGYNVSNDTTQGLLDILGRGRPARELDERWGIICVSKSGDTLETAIAFRQFYDALRRATEGTDWLSKLVYLVTGPESNLHKFGKKSLTTEVFFIPPDVGGRYSIFTPCGLLPAAVLGLDIVKLLEGASAMTSRFQRDGTGSNPVLDFTGVCHLMETRGATIRVLSLWDQCLEALGFWYDQLLSESLGKKEKGATPITVVNTRDLHSRGQQHQEGRRDKLITNVIVGKTRREPLPVGQSDSNHDGLNQISDKTLPEILKAAIDGTAQAYKDDNRPTANINLPAADEFSLGQLYQMLMLATSLEGYLIGINPYGQPGVQAYKKHMQSLLFANR